MLTRWCTTVKILGSKYIKVFYISLGMYGIIVLVVVSYLQYSGNRIATVYAPLIAAAMEIKLEVSQSRLEYQDTYFANNPDFIIRIKKLDDHIHNAKWYVDAMLSGGKNKKIEFISVDNSRLRTQISSVKKMLVELDDRLHEAMFEQDDIVYNDQFNMQLINTHHAIMFVIGQVESVLKKGMLETNNSIIRMNGVVIILLSGSFIFLLYIRLHKEGSESISALHQLTMRDSLTGIYNRRYLDENIELIWKQLARSNGALSLIMCDIDYFKKYNDTFGHIQGDACLIEVAKIIESALVRETDFVARYGGEEFCIVLPMTDYEGAVTVMQNIHDLLLNKKIPHTASEVSGHVTLSAGIATIHADNYIYDVSELLHFSDQALYSAKQSGRNQTFLHNDDIYTNNVVRYAS